MTLPDYGHTKVEFSLVIISNDVILSQYAYQYWSTFVGSGSYDTMLSGGTFDLVFAVVPRWILIFRLKSVCRLHVLVCSVRETVVVKSLTGVKLTKMVDK